MKIVVIPEVRIYLNNLGRVLYEKEYFDFEESAKKYVVELFNDIKINLPTKQYRPAPKYFDRYGKDMEYAIFRKNRQTQWYVFFRVYIENREEIYQIRYIANNHTVAYYL